MRYALISDIHSNLEALEQVLADIDKFDCDQILSLGDVVGYGPNPNECLDLLLRSTELTLGGNHDWAVVGKTNPSNFNRLAKKALDWTKNILRGDLKDFLKSTQSTCTFHGFQLAHSSPSNPREWHYIITKEEAAANYPFIKQNICFIGHTHIPVIIELANCKASRALNPRKLIMEKGKKYIVNVGSIGQPRDNNPSSSWVIYDDEEYSVEYRRVNYDIVKVQEKMQLAGLPDYLVKRLAKGH
ncbi:MAG TPA: metallophosphoesterase family protein [Nitrospinota bacterium]|jgi:predicted phosphodiesterase|nr:metallophosphoesterase family protein [Nitrospinota bacterium]|tara:strand:- start:103999 stop:104727 length:729 start_codon:yes stop_codon:yes gene_type:complete